MSIFFKNFSPYRKLRTANWPIAWRKQTQPYNKYIYYIRTEIYYNIIWQINIICWKLLAIWLVRRFFSPVKIILCPITGRRRKSSLVKTSYRFSRLSLSAFTGKNSQLIASSSATSRFADIVSVDRGIHRRTRKLKKKKKTEQNIALLKGVLTLKGESRAVEEIPPDKLNSFISEFIVTMSRTDQGWTQTAWK